MPYYVILPMFAVALGAESLGLLLCAAVPAWRRALPHGSRMLLGSLLGFVTANLASLLIGVVPVLCAMALHIGKDDPGAQIVAAFTLLGLFFGPLVVSPLGFVGGAWVGLRRSRRERSAA